KQTKSGFRIVELIPDSNATFTAVFDNQDRQRSSVKERTSGDSDSFSITFTPRDNRIRWRAWWQYSDSDSIVSELTKGSYRPLCFARTPDGKQFCAVGIQDDAPK
ncbi:MAG TPA: hypothetical protein VKT77_00560, partial [Chthonomonadaceae bacterium]|nr:hypothetical protein [Chthonomonadaceae bacterium]